MISSIFYNGDGSTRIFPVTFKINGEDYVRVYVDNVEVIDRTKYDIINNSVVFTSDDIPAVGTDNIKIYVATSASELGDLGAPLTDITNVANSLAEIVAVSTQVIPNLPEILLADNNATIATSQATIATTQAGEASASATSASNSATTATTKANEASASATSASNSATSASNSATTATTKANEASASATTATTKASEASASATSASTSANTATTKASEASASATTATTKANTATTKAAEASASATSASTSANNASASETNSALSETNALSYKNSASDSADTATTQAGIATTKAGEASTSASQALGYRNEALGYRNEAEASALSIDSANLVHKTGDETIAGVKTFSSSPIVPTPTAGTQAVNKQYVDSFPILPIGTILNGYTILTNCIVAFGGEFNRADYPKLWAYLQANPSLVKTQAEWTTEATANGGICGYFSSGNGTTTFRVPNLDKAFLRPDSRGVGSFQADELKSHSHSSNTNVTANAEARSSYAWGYAVNGGSTGATGGTETRPKNIAVLPLIVAK